MFPLLAFLTAIVPKLWISNCGTSVVYPSFLDEVKSTTFDWPQEKFKTYEVPHNDFVEYEIHRFLLEGIPSKNSSLIYYPS